MADLQVKPREALCSAADRVVGAGNCWPVERKGDVLPAIVYHSISVATENTFDAGVVITRQYMRVEIHARQYDETRRIFDALVVELKKEGRLAGITGGLDERNDDANINRYIATLIIY